MSLARFWLTVWAWLVPNILATSQHTNNWAVIVSTSRFYTNYRHTANALTVYHHLRRLGMPDSQIILMLADVTACDPRNPFPGTIFSSNPRLNLFPDDIDVDYKGLEVNADTFRAVLTGHHYPFTPLKKRLLSDKTSNVLVYITGHSGNGFLKFHDFQELTSVGLAHSISAMYTQERYHRLLVVADTCQGETLLGDIHSPNVIAIASSRKNENSYAFKPSTKIGAFVIDRFTHYMGIFLQSIMWNDTSTTLNDLISAIPSELLNAHISVNSHLPKTMTLQDIPMTDFFGITPTLSLIAQFNPISEKIPITSSETKPSTCDAKQPKTILDFSSSP